MGTYEQLYLTISEDQTAVRSDAQLAVLFAFQERLQQAPEELPEADYEKFVEDYYRAADVVERQAAPNFPPPRPNSEDVTPAFPPVATKSAVVQNDGEYVGEQLTEGETSEAKIRYLFRVFYNEVARCPITGQDMDDPVITPDGFCYERKALEAYLATHNSLTPQGVLIPTAPAQRRQYLLPNSRLQSEIGAVLAVRGQFPSDQAELHCYRAFLEALAYQQYSFGWVEDPLLLASEDNIKHVITGGPVSQATKNQQDQEYADAEDTRKSEFLIDPFSAAPLKNAVLLPNRIAYRGLQDAMKHLQAGLEKIGRTSIKTSGIKLSDDIADILACKFETVFHEQDSPVQPIGAGRRPVAGSSESNFWWNLGHLHRAWWSNWTSYTSLNLLLYAIKVPLGLTVGSLFTPISALARINYPELCEPRKSATLVSNRAKVELLGYGIVVTSLLLIAHLGVESVSFLLYPAFKALWEISALGLTTGLTSIAYATVYTYIFLAATVLTAAVMSLFNEVPDRGYVEIPSSPSDDIESTITAKPKDLNQDFFAPGFAQEYEVPEGTQAPAYILWRREPNFMPVEPHLPMNPKRPLISPA